MFHQRNSDNIKKFILLSIWVFPNVLVFLSPLTDLYCFSGLLCLVRCSNWLHVYHSQLHRQMGELVAESWAGSLFFSFKLWLVYLLQIVNLNFQLSLLWISQLAFPENSLWRYWKELLCFSFPESVRKFRNSSLLIFSGSSFIQDLYIISLAIATPGGSVLITTLPDPQKCV